MWKLFFGDRDEILIHEVDLSRNNDSPTLPSGFNYCAEGLDTGVFTQAGPEAVIGLAARDRALVVDHAAGEIGEDRGQSCPPWPVRHVPIGRSRHAPEPVSGNPAADR